MFHRGTLDQFDTWHDAAKNLAAIPAEGKIGNVNGIPAPQNQRTIAVSEAIAHPINNDDYIWQFCGHKDENFTSLTFEEVRALGFFAEDI